MERKSYDGGHTDDHDEDADTDVDADTDTDTDADSDADTDTDTESGTDTDSDTCTEKDESFECADNPDTTCEDLCRNTRAPDPPPAEAAFDMVEPCGCFDSYDDCIADCLGPDGLQDGINPESTDGWDMLSTQFCVYEENCHYVKHYGDCAGLVCPECGASDC